MNNTMNNHVHKQESADNEKQPIIDNVEAMDTTEGIITDINNLYHHVININYPNWITGLAAESSTIHKPASFWEFQYILSYSYFVCAPII